MKFNELKTAQEYYVWSMVRKQFSSWIPWGELKFEAQEWWRQDFVRERRERYEKGIYGSSSD